MKQSNKHLLNINFLFRFGQKQLVNVLLFSHSIFNIDARVQWVEGHLVSMKLIMCRFYFINFLFF